MEIPFAYLTTIIYFDNISQNRSGEKTRKDHGHLRKSEKSVAKKNHTLSSDTSEQSA